MEYFPDLCLLMMSLTVWTATYQFSQKLQQNTFPSALSMQDVDSQKIFISSLNNVSWPEVYYFYKGIRQLCGIVNHAFGLMVTFYLGIFLFYQSTSIDNIISEPNAGSQGQAIYFAIASGGFLLVSADACHKVIYIILFFKL